MGADLTMPLTKSTIGSVRDLDLLALGGHEPHMLPGAAHGTGMFEPHPRLERLLFDWFRDTVQ